MVASHDIADAFFPAYSVLSQSDIFRVHTSQLDFYQGGPVLTFHLAADLWQNPRCNFILETKVIEHPTGINSPHTNLPVAPFLSLFG